MSLSPAIACACSQPQPASVQSPPAAGCVRARSRFFGGLCCDVRFFWRCRPRPDAACCARASERAPSRRLAARCHFHIIYDNDTRKQRRSQEMKQLHAHVCICDACATAEMRDALRAAEQEKRKREGKLLPKLIIACDTLSAICHALQLTCSAQAGRPVLGGSAPRFLSRHLSPRAQAIWDLTKPRSRPLSRRFTAALQPRFLGRRAPSR